MTGGLAAALPLALGAAVSPTVLIANLLVLSSPQKARIRGSAFAIGGFAVLTVVGVLALTVLHTAAENRGKDAALFAWVDIVFAALLALVGLRSLLRPPKPEPPSDRASKLAHAPTYDYLAFGVVIMLTNVTTLMLFIPAMKDIAVADGAAAAKVGMAVLVILITTLVIWVPLGLDLVAPHTAGRVLGRLNRFLSEHQRTVGIAVAFGFAVYLAVKGVREL
jgi:threonine/homoserine/homoserine lactone efflux protein